MFSEPPPLIAALSAASGVSLPNLELPSVSASVNLDSGWATLAMTPGGFSPCGIGAVNTFINSNLFSIGGKQVSFKVTPSYYKPAMSCCSSCGTLGTPSCQPPTWSWVSLGNSYGFDINTPQLDFGMNQFLSCDTLNIFE